MEKSVRYVTGQGKWMRLPPNNITTTYAMQTKFTEWLDKKPEKFVLNKSQEHPELAAFEESYARLGGWNEVKRAANWPEGVEVAEFLKTIRERIEKHGRLPQREWHLKKLYAKVKDVMPEHGKFNEIRRLEKRLNGLAYNSQSTS